MAQEVECWTLHLVGGVVTTTRVWGLNPEEAGLRFKVIFGNVTDLADLFNVSTSNKVHSSVHLY